MMKFTKNLLLFLAFSVVVVAAISAWGWQNLHAKTSHSAGVSTLEVSRGERLDQILQRLQEQGIIDFALPLRFYIKVTGIQPVVQAGFYNFPTPISPLEVLDVLQKGGSFGRLTVIEGWTRYEIADALMRIPSFHLKTKEEALKLFDNVKLIRDMDSTATNLEGYLFPDTYFIVADTKPQELVEQMVHRFREVWHQRLAAKAKKANRSVHRVVTEASIIETEAKLKSERPVIASVVENRLRAGMSLAMDSTVIYASKLAGKWRNDGKVYLSDISRNSPYNTRLNKGLPPGPVASPGLSSLEASACPASTNYLYYVRNPDRNDGAHNFYSNSKGFEQGVAALRAWESKHPADRR